MITMSLRFRSIHTLVAISFLLFVGCDRKLPPDEHILCTDSPKILGLIPPVGSKFGKQAQDNLESGKQAKDDLKFIMPWFYIRVYETKAPQPFWVEPFPQPRKFKAKIEARKARDNYSPLVVLGNQLEVGDVFKFEGMSWKLLDMGKGYDCRKDFIHIKELEYQPPPKK